MTSFGRIGHHPRQRVKPLERRGLVVSRSHATNGRVRLAALTDLRRAVLAALTKLCASADDRATWRYNESEVHTLRRLATIDQPGRVLATQVC